MAYYRYLGAIVNLDMWEMRFSLNSMKNTKFIRMTWRAAGHACNVIVDIKILNKSI